MQNKKNEARKIDFFLPHGGRQKCVCDNVAYTKHSHFNMVLTWGFIPVWTLFCSSEIPPANRPVAFYLKGVALFDILRLEV